MSPTKISGSTSGPRTAHASTRSIPAATAITRREKKPPTFSTSSSLSSRLYPPTRGWATQTSSHRPAKLTRHRPSRALSRPRTVATRSTSTAMMMSSSRFTIISTSRVPCKRDRLCRPTSWETLDRAPAPESSISPRAVGATAVSAAGHQFTRGSVSRSEKTL